MSLSLSEEHVWESVTCNLPSASVAVCQYLLGNEQDTPPIGNLNCYVKLMIF